jgi:hypothetical protein
MREERERRSAITRDLARVGDILPALSEPSQPYPPVGEFAAQQNYPELEPGNFLENFLGQLETPEVGEMLVKSYLNRLPTEEYTLKPGEARYAGRRKIAERPGAPKEIKYPKTSWYRRLEDGSIETREATTPQEATQFAEEGFRRGKYKPGESPEKPEKQWSEPYTYQGTLVQKDPQGKIVAVPVEKDKKKDWGPIKRAGPEHSLPEGTVYQESPEGKFQILQRPEKPEKQNPAQLISGIRIILDQYKIPGTTDIGLEGLVAILKGQEEQIARKGTNRWQVLKEAADGKRPEFDQQEAKKNLLKVKALMKQLDKFHGVDDPNFGRIAEHPETGERRVYLGTDKQGKPIWGNP